MKSKCICQTCACGKHRCPHFVVERKSGGSVTSKEACKVTEYRGEFKKESAPAKITRHRPSDCIKPEGHVDFDTIHQKTFHAHPIELSPLKKKAEVKVDVCTEPMQEDTEYGEKYIKGTTEIPAPPEYIFKKTKPFSSGETIVGASVTQEDFNAKEVTEKPQLKKLKNNHVLSSEPFEAKSVNHTDYMKFNEPPMPSGRIPDTLTFKGQPAYFDTTTKSHYKKHEHKPVLHKGPKCVYEPSTEPFEGNSLMKEDYGAHENLINTSQVKHDNNLFASNEPMPNKTTNSAVYQSWGGHQKATSVRETSVYRPPSKDMDLQKTSDDYKNFGSHRPSKSLRPKTNIVCGGEFDGTTSYTDRFVKHDANPRLMPILSREHTYQPATVPFKGCSENKDHYKKLRGSPAKMVRRINEVFEKNGTFDAHTSYNREYTSKKLPACPIAKGISQNFEGFRMVETGDGHCCLENSSNNSEPNSLEGVPPLPPITETKGTSLVKVK